MSRVLITGARSRLARAIAERLFSRWEVRLVDRETPLPSTVDVEGLTGDLRDRDFAATVVRGVDAIVHLSPIVDSGADLEILDRATRGTFNLLTAARDGGARRVVLASTLDLFARYPATWMVDENWQPRPTADARQLAPYLAERSAGELSRDGGLSVICLRLDSIVEDADLAGRPYDPRWLHQDDAAQAFEKALTFDVAGDRGWWLFHVSAASPRSRFAAKAAVATLDYRPGCDFHEYPSSDCPEPPRDVLRRRPLERPIRNVVIFGAGGPLGAIAARKLADDYVLRLTDVRPLSEVAAEGRPQSPGAPIARPLVQPHENRVVDITDPAQVEAACAGMDAIVNCTVVREHPVEAFRVNLLGAYNVMRAAVALDIERVVHTGPALVANRSPSAYADDFAVSNDVPLRAGPWLYGHTKLLSYEVCRIFAEERGLEVPLLLFSQFVDPRRDEIWGQGIAPHTVSWDDAGRAIRRALEASTLPRPFEPINILGNLPLNKFTNDKAREVLGWSPRDSLDRLWTKRLGGTT